MAGARRDLARRRVVGRGPSRRLGSRTFRRLIAERAGQAVPGGACPHERVGGGEPAAADGERVPESRGLLRPDASVAERCALIEVNKANYKITWMCDQLGVARSSFYSWRNRTDTPTAARRRALAEHVKQVFDDSRHTSGCRRVAAQLNREGHECSVGLSPT
jgi:hypothetical protein